MSASSHDSKQLAAKPAIMVNMTSELIDHITPSPMGGAVRTGPALFPDRRL